MEFRSKKCLWFTKNGVKEQKKMWTRGGGVGKGTTLVPPQTPAQLTCRFFTFLLHCGPWTQTIKFSMPPTLFPKESQTEVLPCSWLVSKIEQKQGVRWGNSEVLFIHYPRQNWGNRALLRSTQGLDLNTALWKAQVTRQQNFH